MAIPTDVDSRPPILRDPARLAALRRTGLLDTPAEESFDRLARVAMRLLRAPVALLSLVDADRQFFKSCMGLGEPWATCRQTPLSHSFCQWVVASGRPLIVEDARTDARVRDNKAITDLGVIAYLGMPLTTSDGHVLGALCVIDSQTRHWSDDDVRALRDLTAAVMTERETREKDSAGTRTGISAVARDITARRQAEQLADLHERRAEAILNGTLDAVVSIDEAGRIVGVNARAEELFGYRRENILGRLLHEVLVPPALRERHCAGLGRFLRTGQSSIIGKRVEVPALCADGSEIPVELTVIDGPHIGPRQFTAFIRDLSRQKRYQAERDRVLERYRLQFARMPIACLTLSTDFRVTDWNPAAENIFGYTRDEVLGKDVLDVLVPAPARAYVNGILARLVKGDMMAHAINENTTKDGAVITCEWYNTPLKAADGTIEGFLSMVINITERMQLENRFRQAQKMEAIGRLAGGVAHDFNNLLTIINGYTDLIQAGLPPGDPTRDLMDEIKKAADRSAGLTRQLLAFSRQQVLAPQVLDLNTVITDLQKMLRRVIGEDVKLITELAPDTGFVRADRGQLEQVLLNLAVNARDAMPRGGTITITTRSVDRLAKASGRRTDNRSEPFALLTVGDTGCGMTPEVKARVFEPFFTTKAVGKGTGLGLATVFGIVEQSNGHIDVESEPNVGTQFSIYLPSVMEIVENPSPASDDPDARRGSETILVVEDEEKVRSLARRILEEHGYKVIEAGHGGEAFRVCESHDGHIDLLVTDVVMPELGGRLLAEVLQWKYPEIRVLFISGYTDDAVVRHGVFSGAVNFLQKPFAPLALVQKVREILDSRRPYLEAGATMSPLDLRAL